jgi:hypothetical protein
MSDEFLNCECGHPVGGHFAGGESTGLGFHDRMCRVKHCQCVRTGGGRTYQRPRTASEQIADLRAIVLAVAEWGSLRWSAETQDAYARLRKDSA